MDRLAARAGFPPRRLLSPRSPDHENVALATRGSPYLQPPENERQGCRCLAGVGLGLECPVAGDADRDASLPKRSERDHARRERVIESDIGEGRSRATRAKQGVLGERPMPVTHEDASATE